MTTTAEDGMARLNRLCRHGLDQQERESIRTQESNPATSTQSGSVTGLRLNIGVRSQRPGFSRTRSAAEMAAVCNPVWEAAGIAARCAYRRPTSGPRYPWGSWRNGGLGRRAHSISLPPETIRHRRCVQQLFTNALDWDAPSLLPANQRPAELSAHFFVSANGSALGNLSAAHTSAPGTLASAGCRGRANCNDDSIGIELEGLEGLTSRVRPITKPLGSCVAICSSATPCTTWRDTNTSPQAANKTPAPASTGPKLSSELPVNILRLPSQATPGKPDLFSG